MDLRLCVGLNTVVSRSRYRFQEDCTIVRLTMWRSTWMFLPLTVFFPWFVTLFDGLTDGTRNSAPSHSQIDVPGAPSCASRSPEWETCSNFLDLVLWWKNCCFRSSTLLRKKQSKARGIVKIKRVSLKANYDTEGCLKLCWWSHRDRVIDHNITRSCIIRFICRLFILTRHCTFCHRFLYSFH